MRSKPPTVQALIDAPTPVQLALRPREAAAALGIGTRLLWQLTNDRTIPHLKLGRCTVYPVDLLRDYLAQQATGGGR